MFYLGLVLLTLFCAYQVMRAERLMLATIWLAGTSALISILLYLMGAFEVAVIELSVGAGLVTVLFVFAFSIVGEDAHDLLTIIPRPLVWSIILSTALLLGWFIFPLQESQSASVELPFTQLLWEQRGLDVIAQVVLIFAGVIGVVGLLSEPEQEPGEIEQPGRPHPLESLLPSPDASPVLAAPDGHRQPDTDLEHQETVL